MSLLFRMRRGSKRNSASEQCTAVLLVAVLISMWPVAVRSAVVSRSSASSTRTILRLISESDEHGTLASSLQKTGLLERLDLDGEGGFTLFAPTDAAFELLFRDLGKNVSDVLGPDKLRDLIMYHFMSGQVTTRRMKNGQVLETLSQLPLGVDASDGEVRLIHGQSRKAIVTGSDIEADNGVVHVIDRVLVPPTMDLVARAVSLGLNHFVNSINRVGLGNALRGGKYTVFAPSDSAFEEAPAALPVPMMEVLKYHILDGAALSGSLNAGSIRTAVSGLKIGVNRDPELVLTHGVATKAVVISKDIMARNGVLHVIDVVLTPPTQNLQQLIAGLPQLSFFHSAVQTAGLSDMLASGNATPLTVFAPRNAAWDRIMEKRGVPGVPAVGLDNLVKHHIAEGYFITGSLSNGANIPVLVGRSFEFRTEPGSRYLDVHRKLNLLNLNVLNADDVKVPDLMATNGVLQDIGTVLIPKWKWMID